MVAQVVVEAAQDLGAAIELRHRTPSPASTPANSQAM
jgi:hypothetical protein